MNTLIYKILLMAFAIYICSCDKNSSSGTTVKNAADEALVTALAAGPINDAVIWTSDHTGNISTLWVRGNALEITVIASRPGLVVPWEDKLWTLETNTMPIALCDCAIWSSIEYKGQCPENEELNEYDSFSFTDLTTGNGIELLPETLSDEEFHLSEYKANIIPVASLGPYLFIRRTEQRINCGETQNQSIDDYIVLNLETGESTTIMNTEEQNALKENEREAAYHLMLDENTNIDEQNIKLTGIMPGFDVLGNLILTLQFSTQITSSNTDDLWQVYTHSVVVPTSALPEKLKPYAHIPSIVVSFSRYFPSVRLGGWFLKGLPGDNQTQLDLFIGNQKPN